MILRKTIPHAFRVSCRRRALSRGLCQDFSWTGGYTLPRTSATSLFACIGFCRTPKNVKRVVRVRKIKRTKGAKMRGTSVKKAPLAQSVVVTNVPRRIRSVGKDSVVVNHRECVCEIQGHTTFEAAHNVVALQPGLAASFPWLCGLAARYEKYRFRKLKYSFVPIVSASTNGVVSMVPDYDALDPAPTTFINAMQYAGAKSSPVWQQFSLVVPKKTLMPSDDTFYVRTEGLGAAVADLKTYDIGNLFICCEGMAADHTVVGHLYVDYEIELITPNIDAGF